LSIAYQIENYGHEEISILGKNQKLTKKYPLRDFFRASSKLMHQMLKKISKKQSVLQLR